MITLWITVVVRDEVWASTGRHHLAEPELLKPLSVWCDVRLPPVQRTEESTHPTWETDKCYCKCDDSDGWFHYVRATRGQARRSSHHCLVYNSLARLLHNWLAIRWRCLREGLPLHLLSGRGGDVPDWCGDAINTANISVNRE